jgi:succinate dehydrogenase/fumarate reductase cytochrome b subunit
MSTTRAQPGDTDQREPGFNERLAERPAFDARKLRETRPGELLVRFAAGALASIVSGVITLVFGPGVGGAFLAFPAILAASLTLIEEQEDSKEAREDARGAVAGACGLTGFAIVAALALSHVSGGIALLLATTGWAGIAFGLYAALWLR